MLIPQSMAYAELAGMAPEYGFYAVIGALVVYAMVGTSRHSASDPNRERRSSPPPAWPPSRWRRTRYVALMAGLALVVAAICILGAIAAWASWRRRSPSRYWWLHHRGRPDAAQQPDQRIHGVSISAERFFTRFAEFFGELDEIDAATLAVGAGTLAFILVLRRRTRVSRRPRRSGAGFGGGGPVGR